MPTKSRPSATRPIDGGAAATAGWSWRRWGAVGLVMGVLGVVFGVAWRRSATPVAWPAPEAALGVTPGHSNASLPTLEGIPFYPGRRRDEVPPIDHPVFAAEPTAAGPLARTDRVLGVVYGGEARAYPLWILSAHEIVNDRFGAEPVCVTYCPLSASPGVFLARHDSTPLRFGNEGSLFEGNLILYDRPTHSLWYQLRGAAVLGPRVGRSLVALPAELTDWGAWRGAHPETLVLVGDERAGRFFRVPGGSAIPGASREAVDDTSGVPVTRRDARLPARQRVLGLRLESGGWAVAESCVVGLPDGRHALPGAGAWLELVDQGRFRRAWSADGRELPLTEAYWFAWYAAFPDGVLVTNLVASRRQDSLRLHGFRERDGQ